MRCVVLPVARLNRYVPAMVGFLERIADDENTAQELVLPSVALIGYARAWHARGAPSAGG